MMQSANCSAVQNSWIPDDWYFNSGKQEYKLTPQNDLTPIELLRVIQLLEAVKLAQLVDIESFIEINDLERHFTKVTK